MHENLILTAASGYGDSQIENFVLSLREHSNADVIILVDSKSTISTEFTEKHNITLVDASQRYPKNQIVNTYCSLFKHASMPGLRRYSHLLQHWFFIATGANFDTRMACEFHLRGLPTVRFYEYLNLARNRRFQNAMICDVRDVFFQSDPFINMTHLEAFGERDDITIGFETDDSTWNYNRINDSFGKVVAKDMLHRKVSCCGAVCGTKVGIISYLEHFVTVMHTARSWGVVDQAIHNVLVHSSPLNITMHSSFEGRVVHLNKVRQQQTLPILDLNGNLVPVLHQYDRHEKLAATITSHISQLQS